MAKPRNLPDARAPPEVSSQIQTRITATPEDGKANAALLALLAKALGVPKSALAIVRGESAPMSLRYNTTFANCA